MIDLRDGKINVFPLFAAHCGDQDAPVMADHHAIGVLRIGPHIMIVATPAYKLSGLTSVIGDAHAVRWKIDFIFVVRHHQHAGVVMRAFVEQTAVIHDAPILSAIIGAP